METGKRKTQTAPPESSQERSLEALKLQYARGEIDDAEFEQLLAQHGVQLTEQPSRRPYEETDTERAAEKVCELERE